MAYRTRLLLLAWMIPAVTGCDYSDLNVPATGGWTIGGAAACSSGTGAAAVGDSCTLTRVAGFGSCTGGSTTFSDNNDVWTIDCATGPQWEYMGAAWTTSTGCPALVCAAGVAVPLGIIPTPGGTPCSITAGPPDTVDMLTYLQKCDVMCGPGFTTSTRTVECVDGNPGAWAMTPLATDCTRISCAALPAFDFAGNNAEARVLTTCEEVGVGMGCSLTCVQGAASPSATGAVLSCIESGVTPGNGVWDVTDGCVGPEKCSAYVCPTGHIVDDGTINCVVASYDAARTPPLQCDSDVTNDAQCCKLADCPANASPPGTCTCNAGYTSSVATTPFTQFLAGTGWTHVCTPNNCNVALGTGVVGASGGTGTTACTNPHVLGPVTVQICYATCATAYVPLATPIFPVRCQNDGTLDTTGTYRDPSAAGLCVEKACAAYAFPTGVASGAVDGCVDGVTTLMPLSDPSCTVSCAPGYTGADATISCAATVVTGAAPAGSITCTPNVCSAYTFGTGVGGFTSGGTAACVNNAGLAVSASCAVGCVAGYSPPGGVDPTTHRETISCSATANSGDAPSGSLTCTANCQSHTCSQGWAAVPPGALPTVCAATPCVDQDCCSRAACPANSNDVNVAGVLQMCVCDFGYTGTPAWSTGTESWTHTCLPNCANPAFGGCAAGRELVANPDTVMCAGTTCTAGNCPGCTAAECCTDLVCQPFGTTNNRYVVAGGPTCTTATICGAVSCAIGYTGTPSILCGAAGSAFTTAGCNEVACPANAGGPGVCNCLAGFGVVGGGGPTWDAVGNVWTHACEATCANTDFTGCDVPGKARKPNSVSIFCPRNTGDPMADCDAATCCSALCSASMVCGTQGFLLKPNAPTIQCGTDDPALCPTTTCCDSTCDNPAYGDCSLPGFQLKNGASAVMCPTGDPASCTQNLCCDITDCGSYTCPTGLMASIGAPAACVGPCDDGQCCSENECTPPMANFPWYSILGGPTCTTVTSCAGVTCAVGYKPSTPTTIPTITCPVHGSAFVLNGCIENTCQPIGLGIPGYSVQNAPSCTSAAACGTVTCAAGYSIELGQVPAIVCPTDLGAFAGSGCISNTCQAPDATFLASHTEYVLPNPGCTSVDDCGQIQCAIGYSGTPNLACITPGGAFQLTGCTLNSCLAPLNKFPGYSVANSLCTLVGSCGAITCEPGHTGTPQISCPVNLDDFVLTGCIPTPACPTNAADAGCLCRIGFSGAPNFDVATNQWTHTCTQVACPANSGPVGVCDCQQGYTGVATWGGTNWVHTCTLAACPANADSNNNCNCLSGFNGVPAFDPVLGWTHTCTSGTCSPISANGLDGYLVQFGSTCTTESACGAVTCAPGYTSSASTTPRVVCQANGFFTGLGCNGVPCPSGAGPAGECRCRNGFVGGAPQWTGSSWAHTCQGVACPQNSDGIQGQCNCNVGFTGTPQWSGSQWVHTCTLAQCPPNSGPPGTCTCNSGLAGTPNWTPSGWTHQCGTCPTGGVDTDPSCASQSVNCVDPAILARCPCTCGTTGNQAPTFTMPSGGVVTGTVGANQRAQFLTNIAGPEAGQTVRSGGCTAVPSSLFTQQPVLTLVGSTTASLAFSMARTGQASVTCKLIDNGTPQRESNVVFTISTSGIPPTPTTNTPPCGGVCQFVNSARQVTASTGASFSSLLITNMNPGSEVGQSVSTVCTPDDATLFATNPQVSSSGASRGTLSFVAGNRVGQTTVRCTATDNGSPARSTSFSFNVAIQVGSGTTPVPAGSVEEWLTIRLRQSITGVSRSALARDLQVLFGPPVQNIRIFWVCPATRACNNNINGCPRTESERRRLGCITGSEMTASRAALALQVVTEDVIVDFDIQTGNADGSAAKNQERFTALQKLNADIAQCQLGQNCVLRNQNPVGSGVLTPQVTVEGDDNDDDGFPWWGWVLIALGGLLFISCIIALCILCTRKGEEEHHKEVEMHEEPVPVTPSEPVATKQVYGDTDYSSYEYGETAYSEAVQEFFNGDRVMAQYIDGDYYAGTIEGKAEDGTYMIEWADGTHSNGVPADQIRIQEN